MFQTLSVLQLIDCIALNLLHSLQKVKKKKTNHLNITKEQSTGCLFLPLRTQRKTICILKEIMEQAYLLLLCFRKHQRLRILASDLAKL